MPINRLTGLVSQSQKLGLVNPTPGELRQVLEDCLVTAWEETVKAEGLPLEGNCLIARYWIQKNTSIPAIWLGDPPDENKADKEGCELVVMPDPQLRTSGPRSRVKRWTIRISDRSVEQNRIHYVLEVLQDQFHRGLYYMPSDGYEEDSDYISGLIFLDLVDHLPNMAAGRTLRDGPSPPTN